MNMFVLGDSIARGTFTDKRKGETAPRSIASPNFAEYLQRLLNVKDMVNYARNGISYCSCSSVNSEWALSKTYMQAKNGDIIILAAGTNDYGTDVELGRKEDCEDISFLGAVDVVFRGIKRNNPQAEIFAVLPIPRQTEGKNARGYILDDYRAALEYKAKIYGIQVIDGRKIPINPEREEELMLYMDDGLHPNAVGHKLYADMVYTEIIACRQERLI